MLRAVGERWGHTFDFRQGMIGGCAIDRDGHSLPADTVRLCSAADAVMLGAVGGPKWDDPSLVDRPEHGLLALRAALGVYANLRPVVAREHLADASPLRAEVVRGVDLVVVRELTGGIYFGEKRREQLDDGGELASDACVYTTSEIERVVRVAARLARTRRGKLTSVDKANVLETSRLWRDVATRVVRDEFPEVELTHMLVDACAMHLIRRPADFDVIVTENMFGDILTDEASMLAGSMGLLPSASLGAERVGSGAGEGGGLAGVEGGGVSGAEDAFPRMGLYEPIHGSAPDIAGRGIANPVGAILSAALLLRHSLGLEYAARTVEEAVEAVLRDGGRTADIAAPGARVLSTGEMGAAVENYIATATAT